MADNDQNYLEVAENSHIEVDSNYANKLQYLLNPKEDFHNKILTNLKGMFDTSRNALSDYRRQMEENLKTCQAYVNLEQEDKERQKRALPTETYKGTAPIVVPATMASVHTVIVYMLSVFDSVRPYMQLGGRSGEDMGGAELMELLLDYQAQQNRFMQVLYHWIQDTLVFNMGVVRVGWDKKMNYQTVMEQRSLVELMADPMLSPTYRTRKWVMSYEGNQIQTIDPFAFYPDPRVPIGRLNDGEFCGFVFKEALTSIKKKAMQGIYFNTEFIDPSPKSITDLPSDRDERNTVRDQINSTNNYPGASGLFSSTRDVPQIPEIAEIEVDLVPSDEKWQLPNPVTDEIENNPQKWIFTITNGSVITRAEPFDNNHQKFSAIATEFYSDGHSFVNRGYVQSLKGLNDILDWEVNSRMASVRKVQNDMIVVDPAYVNMDDIMNPSPGKLIRLLDGASGMGIDNIIRQLQTQDVTQNHFSLDIPVLMNMFQRIAVPDNIIGIPQGGRKTAREVAGIQTGATAKLKIFTRLFSETGLNQLCDLMMQNNQQYMSQPQLVRIAGDMLRKTGIRPDGQGFIHIHPESILGKYDYIPHDGSFPLDKMQEAAFWKEFLQTAGAIEPIAQRVNYEWVIEQIARALGIKNFDKALLPPQAVMQPDEEVIAGLNKGNLRPVGTNARNPNNPVNARIGGEMTMEGMMGG